jgi:hypothetical protein
MIRNPNPGTTTSLRKITMPDSQSYSAKIVGDDGEPAGEATVSYDFGENLDEAVELFGAEVVYKRFRAAAVVDLQGVIRRNLQGENPKSEEEIQAAIDEWKPGVQRARKSKQEKALDLLEGMSDEERASFLEALNA